MRNDTKHVSIRIWTADYARLKHLESYFGVSPSEFMRAAIKTHLDRAEMGAGYVDRHPTINAPLTEKDLKALVPSTKHTSKKGKT